MVTAAGQCGETTRPNKDCRKRTTQAASGSDEGQHPRRLSSKGARDNRQESSAKKGVARGSVRN